MHQSLKIKEGIALVLFFTVQFFWLTTAITHSEDLRSAVRSGASTSETSGSGGTPPAPDSTPSTDSGQASSPQAAPSPSVVSAPPSSASVKSDVSLGGSISPPHAVTSQSSLTNASNSPSNILKTTNSMVASVNPTLHTNDLGGQIKYCIVFPLIEGAGWPIPVGPHDPCPNGTTPNPPPVGSPKLTVTKTVVNDNGGTASVSDFTLLVGARIVTSGVTNTYFAGDYVVSEATTTITSGGTTTVYIQTFGGDCDPLGRITLASGDNKVCTVTNDDDGGDEQGGGPDDGDGGNGGDGDDGGDGDENPGGGTSRHAGDRGGSTSGGTDATDPGFMGGFPPEPGAPNAGAGGHAGSTVGSLIFSFVASALCLIYLAASLRMRRFGEY